MAGAIIVMTIAMIEARIGVPVIAPVVVVKWFAGAFVPTLVLAIVIVTLEMFLFSPPMRALPGWSERRSVTLPKPVSLSDS